MEAVQQQLNTANQAISELQAESDWSYPPESGCCYWQDVEDCIEGNSYKCADAAQFLANYNSNAPVIDVDWDIGIIAGCVSAYVGWNFYAAVEDQCPEALATYPELLAEFFGYVDE